MGSANMESLPEVLYEDNHLLIVNKPAGWLVQGDESGDLSLVDWAKQYIKHKYQKPGDVFLGLVHRLDRPVSGVVVLTRTSKALSRMNRLFQERKVEKIYWALVRTAPDPLSGRLIHYIKKDPRKNRSHAWDRPRHPEAKKAELNYRLKSRIGQHYLLEIKPLTGRPHQIRAQLAKMGWPIHGDVKYGSAQPNPQGTIHLHCRALSFTHPVRKEPLTCLAPLPTDPLWDLFKNEE